MLKSDLKISEKLFNEGVDLYEQEKLPEAESKFLEALELQSDSEEIMYNLALVYFEQKKYDLSYALADRIHHLDCDELFTALGEAGHKPEYPIPDDIPEACASCEHFRPGSMIRDEGGFCLFYQQHVNSTASCLVHILVDEGKISKEDIEQNQNKRRDALMESYIESLNDQSLPAEYNCENCSKIKSLTQTERNEKRFICPECAVVNDIHAKIEALASSMKTQPDTELFTILLQSDDFKAEFLLAARKEINRRDINLRENAIFIQMIH